MPSPEPLGGTVVSIFDAARQRLEASGAFVSREALESWRAERIRLERQSHQNVLGTALELLHDAAAVAAAHPIVPDEWSRWGCEWARRWHPGASVGAVVYGPIGSGKSTLVKRLVARVGLTTPGVCYCAAQTLTRVLSAQARREHEYQATLRALRAVDLLVIDDLGQGGELSRQEVSHLWAVVDGRSALDRPLIVTTNQDPSGPAMGIRYRPESEADIQRLVSRLQAVAGRRVPYWSPVDRRTGQRSASAAEEEAMRRQLRAEGYLSDDGGRP